MENQQDIIFPKREINYASFGRRLAAALADGFIITILDHLSGWLLNEPGEDISLTQIFSLNFSYTSTYINFATDILYFTLLTSSRWQGTVGKRLFRIRVTTLEGDTLSIGQSLIRNLGEYISCAIAFIGFFMMLWDKNRQTLHDKMAGSIVVV